jgi:thiosulfate/3-mercaptopyruvate sulfurtransferase
MSPQLSFVALLLLAPSADDKPAARYARPELLMEAGELAKPEVAQQFRVLDVRAKDKYQAGHIPGAVHVSPFAWAKAFEAEQEEDEWAKRFAEAGVTVTTKVVVYDDGSVKDAARVWWILRYWGVRDARLLNGGWPAWQAAGGKVSTETPKVPETEVKLALRDLRLATKDQILSWLEEKKRPVQIIDARSAQEYCGDTETAKRNGAIPGAKHLEWSDLLDPKSKRFKGPEELAKLFKDAGIELTRPAVTYCQSGGRASVMAFGLELMGVRDVRNYYRSWAEWGNDENTPVEKPKKK